MLLLDTHVWIWSSHGDVRQIGRRTRRLLANAESQDALRVSVVSLFEVAALHTLGRLRLSLPPEQWISDALEAAGVRTAELTPAMAMSAGRIARTALADPLDRLLVATAHHLNATLVTSDSRLLEYAASNNGIRAANASR